ncbi:MAG: hypothetical protein U5M53_13340 [Rhodoferax sp.]|nr:hypothetical protein [Rhodoferax sp.]
MTITPEQAGEALQSIEDTGRHSARLYRYRLASPYFLLWGLGWALAYTLTHFFPKHAGASWLAVDVAGLAGSWLLMRARPSTARHHGAWRLMGAGLVLVGFVAASMAVLQPTSGRQISTFVTLVLAAAYALVGLWAGWRLVAIGALVAGVSLIAYFWIGTYFNLWMAFAGGGGLVAVGVWLRKA